MKVLITLCASLLVAAFSFPALGANSTAGASRSFGKAVPAEGLTRLRVNNPVGSVRITAADTDSVKIKVEASPGGDNHFIFHWTWGDETAYGLPPNLHLVTERSSDTLVVCLASKRENGCDINTEAATAASRNGGSDTGHTHVFIFGHEIKPGDHDHGWKADWTIVVPARLALALHLGVGDAEIKGVAGGLQTHVGVGHLDAELPRGPIAADIGVGHIEADVGSSDYGKVNLSAGIGHVSFEVKGHDIGTGNQHNFTAASQTLTGSGRTAYTLKTGVGHVELNLGVSGLSALPPLPESAQAAASIATPTSATAPAPASAAPGTSAPRPASNAG